MWDCMEVPYDSFEAETAREEVDDALEAAEAVWARNVESSRVSRLTCFVKGSQQLKHCQHQICNTHDSLLFLLEQ